MPGGMIERYQLAGLDERQRGFNRPVEVRCEGALYCATLRYESLVIKGEGRQAADAALSEVVQRLQTRGYTQLRSQLSFRVGQYLGAQEPWVEYPDLHRSEEDAAGVRGWIKRIGACIRR
jgi:hypothetical protein